MSVKIKIKPIHILYICIAAFCMKLMEIKVKSFISNPLMLFYIISTIGMCGMVLYTLEKNKDFGYYKKKNRTNKYFEILVGLLIFYYLLFGIFLVDYNLIQYVNPTLFYNLFFLIFIFFVSRFIYKYDLMYKFVNIAYLCIAFFLGICFIQNFDGFQVLKHLSGIFVSFDRYSNAYGLYHKNALGNISLCLLLLSFYISVYKKYILNHPKSIIDHIRNLYNVIIFTMLLASGSRSSLTGFLAFLLLYFCMSIVTGIKNKKIKYSTYFIIASSIIFIYIFPNDLFNIFLEISNRGLNFTRNLPVLFESGRCLVGIGLINPGLFGNGTLWSSTFYVDNYYLYVLMSTGVIGAIIVLLIFILLFISIIKINKVNRNIRNCVMCIFIVDLYVGLFETSVINALFPSCFIYLVIILYSIQCSNIQDVKEISKVNVSMINEKEKRINKYCNTYI